MGSPVIIYCQPDSQRVAICTPVLDCGLTVQEIAAKDVPAGCPCVICESETLPQDSFFFSAWEYDSSNPALPIKINVEAAHEIWKDEWRREREPILKRLDVEWMRALERGDTALSAELAGKKQVLRDVTNTQLPEPQEGESIDSFSQRVREVRPECLNW